MVFLKIVTNLKHWDNIANVPDVWSTAVCNLFSFSSSLCHLRVSSVKWTATGWTIGVRSTTDAAISHSQSRQQFSVPLNPLINSHRSILPRMTRPGRLTTHLQLASRLTTRAAIPTTFHTSPWCRDLSRRACKYYKTYGTKFVVRLVGYEPEAIGSTHPVQGLSAFASLPLLAARIMTSLRQVEFFTCDNVRLKRENVFFFTA